MSSLALSVEEPMVFEHRPVMQREVVDLVASVRPRLIADCTLGGAGHAAALLEALPDARLVGIDRDPAAIRAATERLAPYAERVVLLHERFGRVREGLARLGVERVDAMLVDLGVSSHQLDTAERGFSFRAGGGALDMRMDPTSGPTAAELLDRLSERELARAVRELGEERHATRVARAILRARPRTPEALAEVVRGVVPKSADGIDPATRTFQALRMLVNQELEELDGWLAAVPELLADGGVAVAISFHSLEDRAVKQAFRALAKGCVCPPELPTCLCGRRPVLKPLTGKPLRPSAAEVADNPRARSAKLRAARRLAREA